MGEVAYALGFAVLGGAQELLSSFDHFPNPREALLVGTFGAAVGGVGGAVLSVVWQGLALL